MERANPVGDLVISLAAIRELTTYCKSRNIIFQVASEDGRSTFTTSPSNPSKTRWLGVLKQVRLYLNAKSSVLEKARREPQMLSITEKIN